MWAFDERSEGGKPEAFRASAWICFSFLRGKKIYTGEECK
ncbi:hypothetical protein BRYFOR_05827 [Marvinbryantia formatexigens DSM 14469]|uniref:Uncharacterized protein n=1 Tax=Marvinbryantia formatexigens DSM 14469 TaxID=478749 RepID=C6LB32_9FIRM|nr:hypothetical protein BRYFOR_05827 [Marvinbryantia formatexigens DSM 14469]